VKIIKEHQPNASIPAGESPEQDTNNFSFYVTLLKYPLPLSTWSGTVKGDTNYFDYTIEKGGEKADVFILLKSKTGVVSSGEDADWKKLYAFMFAIAFISGTNAWPYRIEYWRAGRKIKDTSTPAQTLTKTIHKPFSDKLAFNAKNGAISWSFQDTLKLVFQFFENETQLK